MARLELPIRAFIEDFVRRAYPDRDWSRGSAINDLVIKAMSALQQPMRHDIDSIKVNGSIANYEFMTREDLDALAANWGKFRQTGSRSFGDVRLYFTVATDHRLSYMEFVATDGTVFVLRQPVTITTAELLANRQPDDTYTYDVPVQSIGVGSRYSLSRGSIISARNAPSTLLRVENVEDFQTTSPDESNFDVVNSLFRNIGLRNMISRQSLRAPLFETFPGLLDLFIAGADHPNMVRDLVTVRIGTADVTLHLGGLADVWCNTNAVIRRSVTLSYLPSSQRFRLVSARQAAETELLYAFSRLLLSMDSQYAAPDFPDAEHDESTGVFMDQAGLPTNSFIIDIRRNGRYVISGRDIITGSDLIPLPIPHDTTLGSFYLTDVVGVNWANAALEEGDYIRVGATSPRYHRITRLAGRVAEVSPGIEVLGSSEITSPAALGDLYVAGSDLATLATPNCRVVIAEGPGAGHYRALEITGAGIYLGNVLAEGEASYDSDDGTNFTFDWSGPLPVDVDTTCWLYLGDDNGADVSGVTQRFPIVAVHRSSSGVQLITAGGTAAPAAGNHQILRGLRGAVVDGTPAFLEVNEDSSFDKAVDQDSASVRTLYANVLPDTLGVGSEAILSPGVGALATRGDLIHFDTGLQVPEDAGRRAGGDGSHFTVVVSYVADNDTVEFIPPLSFEIPEGTRYALVRNNDDPLATGIAVDAATVGDPTVTLNSFPLGLGDGLGMVVRGNDLDIIALPDPGDPDNATLTGGSPTSLVNVNVALNQGAVVAGRTRPGDTLELVGLEAGTYQIRSVVSFGASDVTYEIELGTATAGACQAGVTGTRVYTIETSTAGVLRTLRFQAPQEALDLTMASANYSTLNPGLIGSGVTQEDGGVTYHGVLHSYNNPTRRWTIIPNDPLVDLFNHGTVVEVVNSSASATPAVAPSALYDVGYFSPSVPADIGLIVRQGSYSGILDSYDAPTRQWMVKPLSDFDTFDSTDQLTYVDRGSGEPTVGEAQGTLIEPASRPVLGAGSAVITLNAGVLFTVTDTVDILSRLGRSGGMFDGTRFRAYSNVAFSEAQVSSELVALLGDNFDRYNLNEAEDDYLGFAGAAFFEFSQPANSPETIPLNLAAVLPAGSTTISFAGSNLGLWGHAGRVALLSVGGTTHRLRISGPSGSDAITLLDPTPTAIAPGDGATVNIVDAFVTPWWTIGQGSLRRYRTFARAEVDEVWHQGTRGAYSQFNPDRFVDVHTDFHELLGGFDPAANDLLLFVDSGPDASVTGYPITGILNADELEVVAQWTGSEPRAQYHIGRKQNPDQHEVWLRGVVVDPTTLLVDASPSWDPSRYGTLGGWAVHVERDPSDDTDWSATHQLGAMVSSYDTSTQTMVLSDPILNIAAAGTPVRVILRHIDREMVRNIPGSAINTYNYYGSEFFTLPLIRIESVQQLNPETLEAIADAPYTFEVGEEGLRYSADERNSIIINNPDAVFQPIRVTYLADSSIEAINNYLNNPDTRVINSNQMAKRMETIAVSVSIQVRSTKSTTELTRMISNYIASLKSTDRLGKDGIIRFLYQENAVTYVDTGNLILSASYYRFDGTVQQFVNASSVFGSDSAAYLPTVITVLKQSATNA